MSATEENRGQGRVSDVVEVKAPISNTRFFARRPLKSSPKVQLRNAPGSSKDKALTPIAQGGFTYLGVMIIVAIMGLGLAALGTIYSQTAQRDKEAELLFVGGQFRDAIRSYYRSGPGGVYPKKLEDLLEDKRFPMPVRHLRRIYRDPITGSTDWGLVETPDKAGIMGVFSRSADKPIKQGNFAAGEAAFDDADNYTKWTFVYTPPSNTPDGK